MASSDYKHLPSALPDAEEGKKANPGGGQGTTVTFTHVLCVFTCVFCLSTIVYVTCVVQQFRNDCIPPITAASRGDVTGPGHEPESRPLDRPAQLQEQIVPLQDKEYELKRVLRQTDISEEKKEKKKNKGKQRKGNKGKKKKKRKNYLPAAHYIPAARLRKTEHPPFDTYSNVEDCTSVPQFLGYHCRGDRFRTANSNGLLRVFEHSDWNASLETPFHLVDGKFLAKNHGLYFVSLQLTFTDYRLEAAATIIQKRPSDGNSEKQRAACYQALGPEMMNRTCSISGLFAMRAGDTLEIRTIYREVHVLLEPAVSFFDAVLLGDIK